MAFHSWANQREALHLLSLHKGLTLCGYFKRMIFGCILHYVGQNVAAMYLLREPLRRIAIQTIRKENRNASTAHI